MKKAKILFSFLSVLLIQAFMVNLVLAADIFIENYSQKEQVSTLSPQINIHINSLRQAYETYMHTAQKPTISNVKLSTIITAPEASIDLQIGNGFASVGVPLNSDIYIKIAESKGGKVNLVYDEEQWQDFLRQNRLHPTTVGCFDMDLNIWILGITDEVGLYKRTTHETVHLGHLVDYISNREFDREISFIQDFNIIGSYLRYSQDKELSNMFKEIQNILTFKYNYIGVVINDFIRGNISKSEAEELILKFFGGQLPPFLYIAEQTNFKLDFDLKKKALFNLTGEQLRNIIIEYQNPPFVIASEFFAWSYHRLAKKAYYGMYAEEKNKQYPTYVGEKLTLLMDKFLARLFTSNLPAAIHAQHRLVEHYVELGLPVMLDNGIYENDALVEQVKRLFDINAETSLLVYSELIEQSI